MQKNHSLLYKEFIRREEGCFRAPYLPELEFYNAIKTGDTEKVRIFLREPLSEKSGLGVLSQKTLQSLKYHFVISAALIARYCIEGGMDYNTAYTLSDYYILTVDACNNTKEISELHIAMCNDYTKRMQILRKDRIYSKHIVLCIDYIYEHLHTRIKVQDLAEYTALSPAYLSRLFKLETGMSISHYIQSQKLETAQNMLQYSDLSISEIAAVLAYPSHSYFTEIFQKEIGLTPSQYRTRYYRKLK